MNPLAGPFVVAAALLALGGAAKALRPADTARALRLAGLPGATPLVRVGGALELVVGAGALAFGNRAFAALVAVSYAAFAGFVGFALRRGLPISSCGCLGKIDTPPSTIHVVIDGLAALTATAVVIDPGVGLSEFLADQPLAGAPFVLLAATAVYLASIAFSALPRTLAAMRALVS